MLTILSPAGPTLRVLPSWTESFGPRPELAIMKTCRNKLLTCGYAEPPIGIEPMTYALREACSLALMARPAQMTQSIAPTTLIALVFCGFSFHDPFHGLPSAGALRGRRGGACRAPARLPGLADLDLA